MKAIEATEFIARILKQVVEEKRYTGCVDMHFDCSQGSLCNAKLSITEKKVSVFEISNGKKDLASIDAI